MRVFRLGFLILFLFFFVGCGGTPSRMEPVNRCHSGDIQVIKMGEVYCMDRRTVSEQIW